MSKISDLLAKREKLAAELASEPAARLAALDAEITEARRLEAQALETQAQRAEAERRTRAEKLYRQALAAFVEFRAALDAFQAVRVWPAVGNMPPDLVRSVNSTWDFYRHRYPEEIGLPPLPTEEEIRRREKALADERQKRRIEELRQFSKGGGDLGADARRLLDKELTRGESQ